MWYITFHGGSSTDNIFVYPDGWSKDSPPAPALLPTDTSPPLQELRGFKIVDDLLYVVNAYKKYSQILIYQAGGNDTYSFKNVFACNSKNDCKGPINSILHPYDLTFDDQGCCYVSSQDTNVVTGLTQDGSPLPVAPFLQDYGHTSDFLEGTIVASSAGTLPGVPKTPDVPKPQGLKVKPADGTSVKHSVRGVLFYKGYLYVADEPANAVKVYEVNSGEYYGQIKGGNLEGPVQLVLAETTGILYISSSGNGSVMRYDLSQGAPLGKVKPGSFIDGQANQISAVSGMAFDAKGNFYVADRLGQKIKQFQPPFTSGGRDFITDLPDQPEFICYVPATNH